MQQTLLLRVVWFEFNLEPASQNIRNESIWSHLGRDNDRYCYACTVQLKAKLIEADRGDKNLPRLQRGCQIKVFNRVPIRALRVIEHDRGRHCPCFNT